MKRFDALIATQKTSAFCKVPFLKKSVKNHPKIQFFQKCDFLWVSWFSQKWDFAESWSFLWCNQYIKTLHLRYQMTILDDFHFLPYNGGVCFFKTPVGGVKWCFWCKIKLYGHLLWQKAPKPPGDQNLAHSGNKLKI